MIDYVIVGQSLVWRCSARNVLTLIKLLVIPNRDVHWEIFKISPEYILLATTKMYITIRFSFLGERPYLCQVPGCNKRFTEYSSLYKHHVVHTHNKPYTCNICNKTYRQTSTLANHKRTAHGEMTSDVDMEGDGG